MSVHLQEKHPIVEILRTKKFRRYNFLFWCSLAIITYSQDLLAHYYSGRPIDWAGSGLYILVWVIWAFLTPWVIRLALRYPIGSSLVLRSVSIHVALAVVFAVAIEMVEAVFLIAVGSYVFNMPASQAMLATYLFYTFHVRLIVYLLIVAVTSALNYFYQQSHSQQQAAKLRSQLMSAQLKALKMQIQPHFLFNTHQAIIGLMVKNENKKAIQMLSQLSELLRLTLVVSEEQLISLRKEINIVSLYLKIQQIRFSDRLSIQIDLPKDTEGALVPSFILQPLVENAIQHGFAPYEGAGRIEVTAMRAQEQLVIAVRDNGAGIQPHSSGSGIGIKNITSRLKELYGEGNYAFSLGANGERGVEARIVIPFVEELPMNREIERITQANQP